MAKRLILWLLVFALLVLFVAGVGVTRFHPVFGAQINERFTSPQIENGRFSHPQAIWQDTVRGLAREFTRRAESASPVGLVLPDIEPIPDAPLQVTWFGHSTVMIQIEGLQFLIDPLTGARASPFSFVGPRAFYDRGPSRDMLQSVDVVLISHDHYDHLDYATIKAMASTKARFVVPLGVGGHLRRWGIQSERIIELDWWAQTQVGFVTVTATPARHGSGRVSPFSSRTLWSGFALAGREYRVWYSGDTGWQEAFAEIGERLGPFDLTMIDAGQYDAAWPDWHLSPEHAVEAHIHVRGNVLMPVHWGRYQLAHHSWIEPAERVLVAAACRGVQVILPPPGQPVGLPFTPVKAWWPAVSWSDAETSPIWPTLSGNPQDRVDWRC